MGHPVTRGSHWVTHGDHWVTDRSPTEFGRHQRFETLLGYPTVTTRKMRYVVPRVFMPVAARQ